MAKHKDIDFRVFARAASRAIAIAKGDIIFREGEPSEQMYILLSGKVEISSHGKPIETIEAGRALGFASIVDHSPRATTALAVEPCELAMMDPRKFRFMIDEVPNFAWYVMQELVHRLRTVNEAIEVARPLARVG